MRDEQADNQEDDAQDSVQEEREEVVRRELPGGPERPREEGADRDGADRAGQRPQRLADPVQRPQLGGVHAVGDHHEGRVEHELRPHLPEEGDEDEVEPHDPLVGGLGDVVGQRGATRYRDETNAG